MSPDAVKILKATSRTFYIPISRLPTGLKEVVGSAYLCMRAIDEIEDHPELDNQTKAGLLRQVSHVLQSQRTVETFAQKKLTSVFTSYEREIPEVTARLGEWACEAPASIAPRIWDATATMADRMAQWALDDWRIQNEADLDRYTFSVAGSVGLLICDVGAWFDGFQMDRTHAVAFGRGLQSVNIIRNRNDDLKRGIDFLPVGWNLKRMNEYARHYLSLADSYAATLPVNPFTYFIKIPLALAVATLDAIERGETKLSRMAVLRLVME